MIEESLSGEFLAPYIFQFYFHHDYSNYTATYLRPLFKLDKTWHLLTIVDDMFPEKNDLNFFSNDDINIIEKQAMMTMNVCLHNNRKIYLKSGWDEEELPPMYFRVAEESTEAMGAYIGYWCKEYLKKEINKMIPCNIEYDINISSILFFLPFTEFPPSIHLNTVLENWDNVEDFIENICSVLKKFWPSKNNNFFTSN